jgi:hypothetical protein
MRAKPWHIALISASLLVAAMLLNCDEKATEPEDTLDVTNDNDFCGMVAGYVRNSSGTALSDVRISIFPVPTSLTGKSSSTSSFSYFFNYPNAFTSDTYFVYYLSGQDEHTIIISVYDLHQNLLRRIDDVPGIIGPHLLHFDGLDDQDEPLPEGLLPCEVVAQSTSETDSLRIALAKGINITDQGGLESYAVHTGSDGKYIIGDLPLHIKLLATTTFAPDEELNQNNWPYVEIGRTLTDRFIVSASRTGYTTASDTVTLTPGGVKRLDMTLH